MEIVSTITGAAKYLGVSRSTVARAINSGKFPRPDFITVISDKLSIKSWYDTTLDKYKPNLKKVGNPTFIKK